MLPSLTEFLYNPMSYGPQNVFIDDKDLVTEDVDFCKSHLVLGYPGWSIEIMESALLLYRCLMGRCNQHSAKPHFSSNSCRLRRVWLPCYLLILDRTNWRTNMLTSLLVPYIFFSLPSGLLDFLRGDVGKWIAFIAVVLRLFFPRHFPDWLEMPGSLILLLVVAPNFFAVTLKDNLVGVFICLLIGCYLLQEHIRASGVVIHERKKIFKRNGSSLETIGLIPVKDLARSESFWPKIMQDKLLPGVSSYLRKPIMYEADVIMRGRANMKLNENSRIRQSVYRATIDGKLLAIKKTKEDIYYKGTEDFAEKLLSGKKAMATKENGEIFMLWKNVREVLEIDEKGEKAKKMDGSKLGELLSH
ncbi:hypothetical protein V6N13_086554 [Hibiscus sabdariffa]